MNMMSRSLLMLENWNVLSAAERELMTEQCLIMKYPVTNACYRVVVDLWWSTGSVQSVVGETGWAEQRRCNNYGMTCRQTIQ